MLDDAFRSGVKLLPNIAINIQSLGKSMNCPAMHIFGENSIRHVSRACTSKRVSKIRPIERKRTKQSPINTVDDENASSVQSFAVDGALINHQYGVPARIGLNSVPLSILL